MIRWIVALPVGLYGLWNLFPAVGVVIRKTRPDALPGSMQKYIALMDHVSWPHAALWLAVAALYVATAVRLGVSAAAALPLWALAFAGDIALGLWMRRNPAYDATFTAGDRIGASVGLVVMLACGAAIFFLARRSA